MHEPTIKKQRRQEESQVIDTDKVEDSLELLTEAEEEAKVKAEEDAREREEEEKAAKLTVRMKGIPFEGVTESDIANFFGDLEIDDEGIFIAPLTCVCYVQFKDEANTKLALAKKNYFQGRSVTISQSKPFHRTKDIGVAAAAEHFSEAPFSGESFVIQIRFLPYWTTEDRIMEFYKDFEVLAIHMVWDHIGRTGAQCFVEFTTEEDQKKALEMKGLGKRAKFFLFDHSSLDDMFAHLHPMLDENSIVIKMMQLPLEVTEDDIYSFFKGVDITGAYLAKNWQNKGTGFGFITVANYEQAFKVWAKHQQRIELVGGKKVTYNSHIVLSASCSTELTSTLISMYVREKDAFKNRGNGRGGYDRDRYFNRGVYGGQGGFGRQGGGQGRYGGQGRHTFQGYGDYRYGGYAAGGIGSSVSGMSASSSSRSGDRNSGGAFEAFRGHRGGYRNW